MMNTIANGGVYRAPCLLDCTLDETSGEELSAFARPQAERVLTEQTAAALRTMLEQTVAEGTAQDASGLPGGAAGKTGTAQTGQFTPEGTERNTPSWSCRTDRRRRRSPARRCLHSCARHCTGWDKCGIVLAFLQMV